MTWLLPAFAGGLVLLVIVGLAIGKLITTAVDVITDQINRHL